MINDLKDLQKLFKICRAQGITELKLSGIEIKFGEMPQIQGQTSDMGLSMQDSTNPYANFPQGELTPEQLAFYSSGGIPENDPYNKEAI